MLSLRFPTRQQQKLYDDAAIRFPLQRFVKKPVLVGKEKGNQNK
jgi:hypothetical protein